MGQTEHTMLPGEAANVPKAHGMQSADPSSKLAVPGLQATHFRLPSIFLEDTAHNRFRLSNRPPRG